MANMSYCQFENTCRDLDSCADSLENFLYGDETIDKGEQRHAGRLVESCARILQCIADHEGMGVAELFDRFDQSSDGAEHVAREILAAVVQNEEEAE